MRASEIPNNLFSNESLHGPLIQLFFIQFNYSRLLV